MNDFRNNNRKMTISIVDETPDTIEIGTVIIGFRLKYNLLTDRELYKLEDFHFIVRDVNGKWWHKSGEAPVVPFTRNIFDNWNGFNGPIVWFKVV